MEAADAEVPLLTSSRGSYNGMLSNVRGHWKRAGSCLSSHVMAHWRGYVSLSISAAACMAAVVFCALWVSEHSSHLEFESQLRADRFHRDDYRYPNFLDAAGLLLPPSIHAVLPEETLKEGRVIVVGDIHGCLDELQSLLDKTEFDWRVDTLIAAGDMVDKGPFSLEVLEELIRLGALAVRGNHDDKALAAYEMYRRGDDNWDSDHRRPWIRDMSRDTADWLAKLPFSLSIPSLGLVVVHAGVVPEVALTQQYLSVLYELREVVRVKGRRDSWAPIQDKADLGRGRAWAEVYRGPDHIIFGHDSGRGFQDAPHATGIDTGCVNGDYLTAMVLPSASQRQQQQNSSTVLPPASHNCQRQNNTATGAFYEEWLGGCIVQVRAKESYRTEP